MKRKPIELQRRTPTVVQRLTPPGWMSLGDFCRREGISLNNMTKYVGAELKAKRIGGHWFVPQTSSVRVLSEDEHIPYKSRFRIRNGEPHV